MKNENFLKLDIYFKTAAIYAYLGRIGKKYNSQIYTFILTNNLTKQIA